MGSSHRKPPGSPGTGRCVPRRRAEAPDPPSVKASHMLIYPVLRDRGICKEGQACTVLPAASPNTQSPASSSEQTELKEQFLEGGRETRLWPGATLLAERGPRPRQREGPSPRHQATPQPPPPPPPLRCPYSPLFGGLGHLSQPAAGLLQLRQRVGRGQGRHRGVLGERVGSGGGAGVPVAAPQQVVPAGPLG